MVAKQSLNNSQINAQVDLCLIVILTGNKCKVIIRQTFLITFYYTNKTTEFYYNEYSLICYYLTNPQKYVQVMTTNC